MTVKTGRRHLSQRSETLNRDIRAQTFKINIKQAVRHIH